MVWPRRGATPRTRRARLPEADLQHVTSPELPNPASSGSPEDAVVAVRDVHYAVDSRPIFAGVNLIARRGRITAIMGPSGTGKTTLLKLITAQIQADRGEVLVFGKDLARLQSRDIYGLRTRMGMLFQNGALLTDMSVFENVAFPVREHTDLPEPLVRMLVLAKLEAVGLRGAAKLMPAELSGGMGRRVALARAIVMDPEVLIYDEPFVGLDPISLGFILRLIKQMNVALGITSIVVSHDVQELSSIADDSYLLSDGKVTASGTPRELLTSGAPAVRQFMTGSAEGPVRFHYPAPDYTTQLLSMEER
jgi:phospholipid/cholesterol/gamma-HCH transport system ATP-binding protein